MKLTKNNKDTKSELLATHTSELIEKVDTEIKTKLTSPKPLMVEIKKTPKVLQVPIDNVDVDREWTKVCLVQLDYSLEEQLPPNEFAWILRDKDEIKNKIYKSIKIAKENDVNIMCFPELSFDKEWIDEIKENCGEMIIIGGSYYEKCYNVCPIITKVGTYTYNKIIPSLFENDRPFGRGMESGDALFIFQTRFGRFSVLTCSDFDPSFVSLIESNVNNINFIFCPSCEPKPFRIQKFMDPFCNHYETDMIHVNKAPENNSHGSNSHGKSCIIAKENDAYLGRTITSQHKPSNDEIYYKIFELGKERMIIADISLRGLSVSTTKYSGRIIALPENCYEYNYETENWIRIPGVPLYE